MGDDAKIERANMDGTDNKVLVNDNLLMPSTLAIDPTENIIYWADVLKETIEMVNMDGTGRKTLMEIPNSVWGTVSSLAVFQSQVFISIAAGRSYSDHKVSPGISSCIKTNDNLWKNCTSVVRGSSFYASVKPFGLETQKSSKFY